MRAALAPIAVLLLIVWAISVAAALGWSMTVEWTLLGVAVGLLVVRRFA